jgi:hypothetical protein
MSHYSSQLIPVFLDLGAVGGTTVHDPKGVFIHASPYEHFNGFKNSAGVKTSMGMCISYRRRHTSQKYQGHYEIVLQAVLLGPPIFYMPDG